MSLLAGCPAGSALTAVVHTSCDVTMGQIQKVAFQRLKGAAVNAFTISTGSPVLKASWTPLLAASDGTKVTVSPYIENPTSEPGAARTFGGGNATIGGIARVIGEDPSSFKAVLTAKSSATVKSLKSYMTEGDNVGVFLIDANGQMAGIADDLTTPTKISPIPITALFVGSRKLGGFEAPDSNVLEWMFKPNWSDNLIIFKPTDFNPLTDL